MHASAQMRGLFHAFAQPINLELTNLRAFLEYSKVPSEAKRVHQ